MMLKLKFINAYFLFSTILLLLGGCYLGQGGKPITQVEVHQLKEGIHDKVDSLAAHPLDQRLKRTAAEAQLAWVKRLAGEYPATQWANEVRGNREPVYLLADTSFTLPAGPPRWIRAQSKAELEKIAAKEGKDIFYVSLTTRGSMKQGNNRGIVVDFEYYLVDWERARWNALSEAEKAKRPTPRFRMFEFGLWSQFLAIREGTRLVFYDGPMMIS